MLISHMLHKLVFLPRWVKKIIVITLDIFLCLVATWLALSLRFDSPVSLSPRFWLSVAVSLVISLPVFISYGLYRAIFRFNSWFASLTLLKAISVYSCLYSITIFLIGIEDVPRSIAILQPIILFIEIFLSRLTIKYLLNFWVFKTGAANQQRRALIYGAGSAGRQLAAGLRQGSEIKPIGFIDDDSRLWKSTVNGLPVYGPGDLTRLTQPYPVVTDALLAIPSASRARRKEILSLLSDFPLHVSTIPSMYDLANGSVRLDDIREVEIDEVLGREPVHANEVLLRHNIKEKIVLVTGAGGSIGSELCRQILDQCPKTLILFDLSEFALYNIERELVLLQSSVSIVPVLGSVMDTSKLNRVCRRFGVQTIFHAAAYKHVPMIEMNPAAGIWNNVFGTLSSVEAACQCGVETFVLISTDKAVRPTNVMGCSKRVAELVIQAKSLQKKRLGMHATKLTMVRFGNVLGSSGSVVPIFRQQIKNGGPVTVTHPEIIRYFMTVSEAAQLVIQAGSLGQGGDVMLLDMGDPVKVVDLAKRMIHLSGLSHKDESNPDGDIEIQFTGLRPGEKLYEELLIDNKAMPTSHTRIMRAVEKGLSWEQLEPLLFELKTAVSVEDSDAIRALLKQIVTEFEPQSDNIDVLKC